jgi:hypothetical protein
MTLPLPRIPRGVILLAKACPTTVAKSEVGLFVMCACPGELAEEDQSEAVRILAPYFPEHAGFEFFWPVRPPSEFSADDWFMKKVDAHATES